MHVVICCGGSPLDALARRSFALHAEIGRVPDIEGAYIATGHNVRGILSAPATGEAMSRLIVEGRARSVELSPFDPDRPDLQGRTVRGEDARL